MPGQVSQFQQSQYTTPVNGGALDASVVLGNDNSTRAKHNGHDADATIHIQSSDLATRAAAGVAQRAWWTTDEFRLYFDFGGVWNPLRVRAEDIIAGTISGAITFGGNVTFGDANTDTVTFTGRVASNVEFATDNASDIGASGANRPRDLFLARNAVIGGTLNANGNVVLGDATGDTITFTGRVASNVQFGTDNANDIGAAGANRPRSGYFGTDVVIGTDPGGGRALRVGGGATFNGAPVSLVRGATYGSTDYFTMTDGTGTGSVYLAGSNVMRYNMTGSSSQHSFFGRTNLNAEIELARISHSAVVDDTALLIGIFGTLFRVRVGAANSGGTGFRMLRIDN